jgi:ABC-type transport system substrate-binding protein
LAFSYNPTAALAAFRAAGYAPGAGGSMYAIGTNVPVALSLVVPSDVPDAVAAAHEVQSQLTNVGIEVSIRTEPLATMLDKTLPQGDYELAIAPFLMSNFGIGQATIYTAPVLATTGESSATQPPAGAGAGSTPGSSGTSGLSGVTSPTIAPGVPRLSWASPVAVGTEPGAARAGVVTRDVFAFSDPLVTADLQSALTNLNGADANALIGAAEAQLNLDVPTVPLFRTPVDCVHGSAIAGVSETISLAGEFWDAAVWQIQVSPKVVPTTLARSPA